MASQKILIIGALNRLINEKLQINDYKSNRESKEYKDEDKQRKKMILMKV